MYLDKFTELKYTNEFDDVDFIAKVTSIRLIEDEYSSRFVIGFYDGYTDDRFILYTDKDVIKDLLYLNTVYHFYGKSRGKDRRYFVLKGFDIVEITIETERKYYPERFQKPTEPMVLTYNTSISEIKDNNLRKFVGFCLGFKGSYTNDKKRNVIYNRFVNSPASLNHHDCYRGGYVAHVAGMLANLKSVRDLYSSSFRSEDSNSIDWDLLYALVYLHDIGKPLTYTTDSLNRFVWNDRCLQDHAILGSQYVYSCWVQNSLIDFKTVQKLCYCISEHMNSKYETKVPELSVLRALDNLDSSIVSILSKK